MSTSEALSLRVLQRWFVGMTTNPGLDFEHDSRQSRVVERWIKSTGGELAGDRLAIYRDGYFSRLTECLADDFPVLQACLGELEFEALSRGYIEAYPSRHPNLNRFGEFLPEFIATRPGEHQGFFWELARFEWALVQCVHARADAGFLESLRTVAPDRLAQLRFVPSESLHLFEFEYPVNRIVQAHFDGELPSIPTLEKSRVAVARLGMRVWRLDLREEPFEVLTRLAEGQTLAEALRGISVAAEELQAWFATWAKCGFFSCVDST